MKFFFIPFAGGNKYSLNSLFNHKEIKTLEITRKTSFLEIEEVLSELLSEYLKENSDDIDCFIYGHSMGALLAYLLCQKLQEKRLPMPQKLIISGKKAPNIPMRKNITYLPDEEFWSEIVSLGGIPDEMKNYPELIEYYLPILRHDFRLIENYQYEKKPKLNIPIDVFYGSEDATEEEMIDWYNESTEKVNITQLPGNHFFIFNHIEYFRNYFKNLIH